MVWRRLWVSRASSSARLLPSSTLGIWSHKVSFNRYRSARQSDQATYLCPALLPAPWAYLIGRFPAGRVLGVSTIIWGVCVITMVENKNYAHVMVSRFFLGVFESSVTPGLSLMTGFWYTREEIPLRQTIWYSAIGWGGMIGALMAAGIQG